MDITCKIMTYLCRLLPFYLLMAAVVAEDGNGNKCINKEREALLHFKASIEDPGGDLSTWTGEGDCCDLWNGVSCDDQTGHVIQLDLSNFGRVSNYMSYSDYILVGEISPSLVNLTYLNHLDLSYNSFYGTIPDFIGSMTKLRYLNLGWNSFNGTIPKSIISLTELEYLNLEMNSFHGVIPPELGNLTNMKELHLERLGRCTIENIDWLSRVSHLEYLDMSGISLAKANHWVNVIVSLQNLSSLRLSDSNLSQVMYPYSSSFLNSSTSSIDTIDLLSNNLNSSMYSWLFPLTSNELDYLDLSYNMLDGIPKYLGNLCSLAYLHLQENSAVVNITDFLQNLSSGCTKDTLSQLDVSRSQFIGRLAPDEIQKFSFLQRLNISHNQLDGSISNKVWELPWLDFLDVSSNSFTDVVSENNGQSNLSYIDLSSCKLGPRFPKSIQTLKGLTYLDMANNKISDEIPVGFWNTWPSQLTYLNLSYNNISGEAPDLSSNFRLNFRPIYSIVDLSSNRFSGPVVNASASLVSLNLSRNKFYGGLSFLCQIADGLLFLDLSNNSFTGPLPDCLWHFNNLIVLNLGDNNLSGRLPNSLGKLGQLEVLHIQDNKFSGELPLSLKNCTKLKFLNLGTNGFSGNVPVWIGENLSGLYVLSLRSNNFFGTIPLELCQLANLQILDLSMNHLYGTIPTCLNNFTLMAIKGISLEENVHSYSLRVASYYSVGGMYADRVMIQWHGTEREFTNNLRFLKSIDLSNNNLTGKIPNELVALHELIALNLSMNALLGEIPQNISEMKELLILDLSRNKFSGGLPSSMADMTGLGYLDVSYNNLSGRIPSSTQLQSFEPSRYAGNTRLCGPPITKYCPGDEESEVPPVIGENEGDGKNTDELQKWFYIGGAAGFATGFSIACSALILSNLWRHALFNFLNSSKDWIYVRVVVLISKR